jgi:hypothetical protein
MELPERMFLLAYDPRRERLTRRTDVGLLVRAAALAELELRGALIDDDGRASVPQSRRPEVTDPLLRQVLAEVEASKPRRWQYWVQRDRRKAQAAVEQRLAAAGVVALERRRILGVFPSTRILVRDPLLIGRLHDRVTEALRGRTADPRDASAVALAAAGELGTVLKWRQRRAERARIAELTAAGAPAAVKGLKKAVAARNAATSSGG